MEGGKGAEERDSRLWWGGKPVADGFSGSCLSRLGLPSLNTIDGVVLKNS